MKPQSAKAKGRKWQKRIALALTELFGWEDGDAESRPMGSGGIDIMLSPKARKDFPFSIEAKNTKGFPGAPALEQAQYNAKTGTLGGVVWKLARKDKGIIYFDVDEFAAFWKEHNEKA